MKKVLKIVMALVLMITFSACASHDKEEKIVNQYFKTIEKGNIEELDSVVAPYASVDFSIKNNDDGFLSLLNKDIHSDLFISEATDFIHELYKVTYKDVKIKNSKSKDDDVLVEVEGQKIVYNLSDYTDHYDQCLAKYMSDHPESISTFAKDNGKYLQDQIAKDFFKKEKEYIKKSKYQDFKYTFKVSKHKDKLLIKSIDLTK